MLTEKMLCNRIIKKADYDREVLAAYAKCEIIKILIVANSSIIW